jgi:hypothetical protein
MGVPANQFVGNPLGDCIKVKKPGFSADLGVKNHLQQKIPELFAKIFTIAGLSRFSHLVGFLKGIGDQTLEVLFKIPGTTPLGIPEFGHDVEKAVDRL